MTPIRTDNTDKREKIRKTTEKRGLRKDELNTCMGAISQRNFEQMGRRYGEEGEGIS
jgi:hypothetical protein